VPHPVLVKLKRCTVFTSCNINGLTHSFDEVNSFLTSNPSVAALGIVESKLSSFSFHNININNYTLIRKDRKRAGGGLLLYISDSLPFSELEIPFNFPHECELLPVKVHTKSKPVVLTLVYKPPHVSPDPFNQSLQNLLHFYASLECECVILGDFNIDLLSGSAPAFSLLHTTTTLGFKQPIKMPTRVASTKISSSSTLIDHIFVSDPSSYSASGQFPAFGSDHHLVFTSRRKLKPLIPPIKIQYRKLKEINLPTFSENISDLPVSSLTQFNTDVLFLLDSVSPLKSKVVKGRQNPWYSEEIRQSATERDSLKRQYDRSRDLSFSKRFKLVKKFH